MLLPIENNTVVHSKAARVSCKRVDGRTPFTDYTSDFSDRGKEGDIQDAKMACSQKIRSSMVCRSTIGMSMHLEGGVKTFSLLVCRRASWMKCATEPVLKAPPVQ